jgi:phytanoyl-CoA hydroxylase
LKISHYTRNQRIEGKQRFNLDSRTKFERDGFVALSSFYIEDELLAIEDTLKHFIVERVPALSPEHVFFEDKSNPSSLKQIQQLHGHEPFFWQLMDDKPKKLAQELLGESVAGKNIQYFNKPPGLGKATPPHQDGYYFMIEPCRALTMWLALDEVDEGNGCVRYVRGSHTRGLRPHARTETLGFSQGISDYGDEDLKNEQACIASPGDLLAHHALTIHRADSNQSASRSRRALGFVFYGESAKEDAVAHSSYQQKLTQEMTAQGKI